VIAVQDEEDEDGVKHGPNLPMRPSHRDLRTTATPSPNGAFYPPPSPSSGLAISQSTPTRESADSSLGPSPALGNFPNITSVFPQRPESITDIGTDYEEAHTDKAMSKRSVDGSEKTTWAAKVKTFVARSGSVSGRRSRTNSTTKREEKATNRESGASGTSGKVEHASHGPPSTAPPSAWNSPAVSHTQLSQEHSRHLPMQTTSASASLLSLSPVTPHRGGASPVPPPSPGDLTKYSDAKLMPFPGLVKLDEERKRQRSRGMSVSGSVSSPNLPRDAVDAVYPNSTADIEIRERKLSHQYSDTGLLPRYRNPAFGTEADLFPTTSAQPTTPSTSGSSWLPMSRKDVRKWYQANKFFNPLQSPSSISTAMISLPIQDGNRNIGADSGAAVQQKFNNLLMHKPSSDSTTDFEESTTNTSTTPKGRGKTSLTDQDTMDLPADPFASPKVVSRVQSHQSSISSSDSVYKRDSETDGEARHPITRPALSIDPEPVASDRSWTPSASQTDSSLSYKPSDSPETPVRPPDRASVVLQRLDALLSRDATDQSTWGFIEDPPRKLIMSSSVTQVIDSNTIRERFLFLFNDILVVAKPLEATNKAMDRSFIVKNIIDLNTVQVITNRDEGLSSPSRHPIVQQFVRDFGINADSAVANLLQRSGLDEDQDALGKLLFNTFELDRTRLGGYLSKKSHKGALKSYLDCFGFSGVRIDYALRTFILSIRLPTEAPEHAQEHLLNTFASKWFDVNARAVSFDRDVAMKLVRILVQLDSQIHKAPQGHPNGYDFRPLDFHAEWEAIVRAVDPRGLIPDELIDKIYYSLREDPLRWADDAQYGRVSSIVFKRPPPNHLAHRVQSDPITLRIPHPDPHLRIQLHSQDGLIFDPPELNFARSTEVAFRVTGSSLGPKAIIFSLVGAHAAFYLGIPFSKTVVIERHFMRNTFQVAFNDRLDRKRRYMFSAEDALVCHQWALSLRQPRPAKPPCDSGSDAVRQVQKATNALSLDILREAVAQKLSGHDLIVICKQNSLLPTVLPNVTNVSNSSLTPSMISINKRTLVVFLALITFHY
jgi:serine/arginine repetitive matrix protein 2